MSSSASSILGNLRPVILALTIVLISSELRFAARSSKALTTFMSLLELELFQELEHAFENIQIGFDDRHSLSLLGGVIFAERLIRAAHEIRMNDGRDVPCQKLDGRRNDFGRV